jgi:hypothetical protein
MYVHFHTSHMLESEIGSCEYTRMYSCDRIFLCLIWTKVLNLAVQQRCRCCCVEFVVYGDEACSHYIPCKQLLCIQIEEDTQIVIFWWCFWCYDKCISINSASTQTRHCNFIFPCLWVWFGITLWIITPSKYFLCKTLTQDLSDGIFLHLEPVLTSSPLISWIEPCNSFL